MHSDDTILWSDSAWATYERMPPDVQAGIKQTFQGMLTRYAPIYHQRPPEIASVGTVSHMQVPDWNIWLRFVTEYSEQTGKPLLCVEALEELTQAECEASVAAARANPGRIA
jgi:hypothetical protein